MPGGQRETRSQSRCPYSTCNRRSSFLVFHAEFFFFLPSSPQVRVIPLELQRLFASLLLSDQQSASTANLTDSFGWNSSEVSVHYLCQ